MNTEEKVMNVDAPFHEYLKTESQMMRGIWNYLQMTYENLNDHYFDFDDRKFESEKDFFEFVASVCDQRLKTIDDD